MCENLALIFNC